jgi:hypothetical protein
MELVELLRKVMDRLEPFVERGEYGRRDQDPDRDIEKVVAAAARVIDRGLLIGRGV